MSGVENWFCSLRRKKNPSIAKSGGKSASSPPVAEPVLSRTDTGTGKCGASNPDPGLQPVVTGSGALRLPGGASWSRPGGPA